MAVTFPWTKLNVDCASCENLGTSGCGGFLRGQQGVILGAYCRYLRPKNSVIAKAYVILEGLRLELDSKYLGLGRHPGVLHISCNI